MEGRVVAGVYRVERALGAGGMGAVYEVTQLRTGRRYAMKLLSPDALRSSGSAARFRREAEAIGRLRHTNVIAVHDFDEADGVAYLVMELLSGEDLAQRLEREGRLSVDGALRIFREVAMGLGAAHDAGIVHRDLKPANVFLARQPGAGERAVVLDFGLAKAFLGEEELKLTSTGVVMGTPLYMSPEQASGLPIDPRGDLYALATLLFEMLAGRPPFVAPALPLLFAKLATEAPPSIRGFRPELPEALDAVMARALAKSKEDRYPSAQSLVDAVRDALDPSRPTPRTLDRELDHRVDPVGATVAAPGSTLRPLPTRTKRGRLVIAITTLAVVAIGAGSLIAARLSSEPEPPTRSAPPAPIAAAPRIDAGARSEAVAAPDAGACTTVLGCLRSCDGVFASTAIDESFVSEPISFRSVRGSAVREDGAFAIGGEGRLAMVESRLALEGAVTCIEARLPAKPPGARRYEAVFGLRTRTGGVSFNLRGTDGKIGLLHIGPRVRPIDTEYCDWIGQALEVRILLARRGRLAYGEIERADTGEIRTLSGEDAGPDVPLHVELEMHADLPLRVERVRAGPPSALTLGVLE
jgi:serine/threonine protein kinase